MPGHNRPPCTHHPPSSGCTSRVSRPGKPVPTQATRAQGAPRDPRSTLHPSFPIKGVMRFPA